MGLRIVGSASVSPEFIPASGGTVSVSFDAEGTDGVTRLQTTYSLDDEKPYIFSTGSPQSTTRGPVTVPIAPTAFSNRITIKKSPPSAPREELVIVSLEIQEVDDAGGPVGRPFRRRVSIGIS